MLGGLVGAANNCPPSPTATTTRRPRGARSALAADDNGPPFANRDNNVVDAGETNSLPGHTTAELQDPTGYTGIYANWNVDLDGDSTLTTTPGTSARATTTRR